jgi:hypothetical protein
MENSMEVPLKTKNTTSIASRNPFAESITKVNKFRLSKRYLHSHVYCSSSHDRQGKESVRFPLMDK